MPSYDYECRVCGHTFEATQSMFDDPLTDCPKCGKAVRRIIYGGSGVIFKGSGFYVNDSKGKNAASKSGASQSSEAKPDSSSKPSVPAPVPAAASTKESA